MKTKIIEIKNSCFDKKLLSYCAMASAALATAQPADAVVVYSGVKNLTVSDNGTITVDLNGDGINDFGFRNKFSTFFNPVYGPAGTFIDSSNLGFLEKDANNGVAIAGGYYGGVNIPPGAQIPDDVNWAFFRPIYYGNNNNNNRMYFSMSDADRYYYATGATYFNINGPFAGRAAGLLGVSFQVNDNTHYGWIRYLGSDENTLTIKDKIVGTVVDWAYENVPLAPIAAGDRGCIDNDGDGYGIGAGCNGCQAVLTPGSISKLLTRVFPFKMITLRALDNATITRTSELDWGTEAIKTIFVLPGKTNTIRAFVRIQPLSIQEGDTYEVKVGDCRGQLTILPANPL